MFARILVSLVDQTIQLEYIDRARYWLDSETPLVWIQNNRNGKPLCSTGLMKFEVKVRKRSGVTYQN